MPSDTDRFAYLSPCRQPISDAPMGPPVRFTRKSGKVRATAPPIKPTNAIEIDDDDLQFRMDELTNFIKRWEH